MVRKALSSLRLTALHSYNLSLIVLNRVNLFICLPSFLSVHRAVPRWGRRGGPEGQGRSLALQSQFATNFIAFEAAVITLSIGDRLLPHRTRRV